MNRKIILILCFIIASYSNIEAACSGASPNLTAADCSYTEVNACNTAATYGDVITVPTGSCTWSSILTITKNITLKGAGIDQTTINRIGRLISFTPDSTTKAAHGTTKITGFTFDGHNATNDQLRYTGLIYGNNGSANYVNYVIMNNKFKNTSGTGTAIYLKGTVYGVVSSNQFDKIGSVIRNFGRTDATTDGGPDWVGFTQAYGTSDNIFFENNTISFSSTHGATAGWIETGQGGRIVVRYNTWDMTNSSVGEYWDIHGLQNGNTQTDKGCSAYSTMVAEYYGNKIMNDTTSYRIMYDRGGWLMMFNNSINRGSSQVWTAYFCNACALNGRGYFQNVSNSYVWNNFGNGINKPLTYGSPGRFPAPAYCPNEVTENTQFFNYNGACTSSSCLSGVGCGSSTPTGTCTTGVGYWKTNQSCSDLTGMVGANPSTPIHGTLYKCTSTDTWTAYYTPYTYPHPLTH